MRKIGPNLYFERKLCEKLDQTCTLKEKVCNYMENEAGTDLRSGLKGWREEEESEKIKQE